MLFSSLVWSKCQRGRTGLSPLNKPLSHFLLRFPQNPAQIWCDQLISIYGVKNQCGAELWSFLLCLSSWESWRKEQCHNCYNPLSCPKSLSGKRLWPFMRSIRLSWPEMLSWCLFPMILDRNEGCPTCSLNLEHDQHSLPHPCACFSHFS